MRYLWKKWNGCLVRYSSLYPRPGKSFANFAPHAVVPEIMRLKLSVRTLISITTFWEKDETIGPVSPSLRARRIAWRRT